MCLVESEASNTKLFPIAPLWLAGVVKNESNNKVIACQGPDTGRPDAIACNTKPNETRSRKGERRVRERAAPPASAA